MDREEEAAAHVKKGRKATKSGLFKKPDWDLAATELEKGAQLYQLIKQWKPACQAWEEAFDAHVRAQNLFFAGKAQEALARIATDTHNPGAAAEHLQRASKVYVED
eukprot:RCo023688